MVALEQLVLPGVAGTKCHATATSVYQGMEMLVMYEMDFQL